MIRLCRCRQAAVLLIALIDTLAPRLPAQQNPNPDQSSYLGRPVLHPEAFSEVWEAPNGHGGAVGIHLKLETTVSSDVNTLRGIPQSWQHLEIGLYERKGSVLQFGEQNYFSDSVRGGSLLVEDDSLHLHFSSPKIYSGSSFDLDLVRKSSDRWVGRFHRLNFDQQVTLERPHFEGPRSPIVGTWVDNRDWCVHVVQLPDGGFAGWNDIVQNPGTMRYSSNVSRPPVVYQFYGELARVTAGPDRSVSFEFNASSGVGVSHLFAGSISPDGNTISGAWPSGVNQAPRSASWIKISGDSCVDAP